MGEPTLYGASYSVYARAVRMALAEKGAPYRLVEVDIFAPGGASAEHLARHPFGKIPAFEHDGFTLYEAGAISRYVDEAFEGPALQPPDARRRARMNQAIGVLDSYAYRTLVWDIYVERAEAPGAGRTTDEARVARALLRAETCLAALEALSDGEAWLAGPELTLADLHAAPMFDLFRRTPEGRALMAPRAGLSAWWRRISDRSSFAETAVSPR